MAIKKITILDDDDDLTFLLFHFLGKHEISCTIKRSVLDLENDAQLCLTSDVVVLDINLGFDQPNGLDAYHWLRSQGFGGKIVFFTGHAKAHPLVKQAQSLGANVLEKPTDIKNLVTIIRGDSC